MRKKVVISVTLISLVLLGFEFSVLYGYRYFPLSTYVIIARPSVADSATVDRIATELTFRDYEKETGEIRDLLDENDLRVKDQSLDNALAILKFVSAPITFGNTEIKGKSPLKKYRESLAGKKGLCTDFAMIYTGFLKAAGYQTRTIMLWNNFLMQYGLLHTAVSVFAPDLNKWVVIDPTFGSYFESNGIPLSSVELQKILTADFNKMQSVKTRRVVTSEKIPRWKENFFLLYQNIAIFDRINLLENIATETLSSYYADGNSLTFYKCPAYENAHQMAMVIFLLQCLHVLFKYIVPLYFVSLLSVAVLGMLKFIFGKRTGIVRK